MCPSGADNAWFSQSMADVSPATSGVELVTPALTAQDEAVRGALTRAIARLGRAPSPDALAAEVGCDTTALDTHLRRLADAHALLLHPCSTRPWVVHPFALSPGSCFVRTAAHGYWANCLYCAFGIAAALDVDAVVTTRYGGEDETVRYEVRRGSGPVTGGTDVFHLSTPPARWWDNVIFACASFQPFASEADIDRWCDTHGFPRGASLSMPALWAFARDWYGSYLSEPWRKRTRAEVAALFARHGLVGAFWR